MMAIAYLALIACVVLAVAGIAQLVGSATGRRQIVLATLSAGDLDESTGTRFQRANRRFLRTRLGSWLDRQLDQAGIGYNRLAVVIVLLAITVIVPVVLYQLLAPIFAVVGLAAGYVILRLWLSRAREHRKEKFVQQIPELARVLSNATNAGLSIATAWSVAENEMAEPARSEIARLNAEVRFGASLEDAMTELADRLPASEVQVLMSTLVVSSRSGGSLVKALRDISFTLDDRKEVRREVRTTLAQARSTSNLVAAMSIGMLAVLNVVRPGTVELMTQNLIGQLALVVGFGLIVLGLWIIRRMTRIGR
ncbi:type II secretion protein F [Microlunatus elymi]|uniref:Type II secretion protein F n=1 Tax=Microlunatus elymi TaxID=2596828 RepID=A0A516PZM9_9ACTN|nr:type II secretion system F family protein [Microlunatus elymi]QDP96618.1 type II secretion protein F [Microlunatus elymi]